LPQDRNDGASVENLPGKREELLALIETQFHGHPKVRVLTSTARPNRDSTFRLCRAQRFQAVIDRSGNVFPCPQVAVSNYEWLSYGNVRRSSIREILLSERRRALFGRDVTEEMKCRICDRKDEAINVTLDRLLQSFPDECARYGA
jgi:radical SAM protein with 4Fe4S-binding SPASM domain